MSFKEFDFEGEETLKAISSADRFNHWMFSTIRPFCQGKILEIGSGIGNISQFFLKEKADLFVSDIREQYRKYLRGITDEKRVLDIDIVHPDFDGIYQHLFSCFDTVFALNVVEHVEDDRQALVNLQKLVKPGGSVVILVPSYQALFNEFDRQLVHYRRYTLNSLVRIIPSGARLVHKQYFNLVGIVGWFIAGSVLKKKTIPEGNMKLYNSLVPVIKLVDKITFNKIGLSSIVIFNKV